MEEAFRSEFWRKIWKLWGLRAMVLLTLAVQLVLTLFGHKRKSSHNLKLKIAVWFAYLTANSMATVALGVLFNKLGEVNQKNGGHLGNNDKLLAFWSPLLLILLGGPDTITSYSLEDNALWLRHCLGLAVQTSGTAYIIFMAWTSSYLSYLSSFMALVGLVKYAERVCALWMASNDKLKQLLLAPSDQASLLAPSDQNLNYLRMMMEYKLKQDEGYDIMADEVIEVEVPESIFCSGDDPSKVMDSEVIMTDSEVIVTAYNLFQKFRCLFIEWTLGFEVIHTSRSTFKKIGWQKAFMIVEIELGFLYDLLHTKAMVLYTKWGLLLRSFTFSSTLLVLVLFSLAKKSQLSRVDLSITYLLLAAIVFFETYSVLKLASSDWSEVWLSKLSESSGLRRAVNSIRLPRQPRWSYSIAQFSLLSFCTKERPLICHNMLEFLKINEKLEKYHYTFFEDAGKIRNLIFNHVKQELQDVKNDHTVCMNIHESLAKLLKDSLPEDAQATKGEFNQIERATKGEFDQIVLTWHIATEILYYSDPQKERSNLLRMSMLLSRYMFYLLVRYRSMLPSGIREVRLHHTTTEAFQFFKDYPITDECNRKRSWGNENLEIASGLLLEMSPKNLPSGGTGKSLLYDGCCLAAVIKDDERREEMRVQKKENREKMISNLWMKILMYAATQCRGDRHAEQLRRGGELLTHVWLLMAHFGLTDHFQETKNTVTAELRLR